MKTEIEGFILDAIKGEWRKDESPNLDSNNDGCFVDFYAGHDTRVLWTSDILLDPLAWQAVGKTRGWTEEHRTLYGTPIVMTNAHHNGKRCTDRCVIEWRANMHTFIDHLADGKSIEESLLAIK